MRGEIGSKLFIVAGEWHSNDSNRHSLLTWATNTPMTAVASSGPEDPAAMKVAPATSGGMFRTKEGGKIE